MSTLTARHVILELSSGVLPLSVQRERGNIMMRKRLLSLALCGALLLGLIGCGGKEAEPGNAEGVRVRDLPISFSPIHRQYGYRAVQEIVMTEPSVLPGETAHDPFTELG